MATVIFSRKHGGSGRHARDQDARPAREHTPRPVDAEAVADEVPARGPYDSHQAPKNVQRLDLGSLQIPAVEGVEVRVQANPEGGVEQVLLVHGESALQLGVFAAPRTEGIWGEVREEIRASMAADGVRSTEAEGAYGIELRARVNTPQGPADIRFIGIDGPRWMVRALYQGLAASDPDQEGPLGQCLTGLVIDRGDEARPVREPLPLRLPREMTDHARRPADAEQDPSPPDASAEPDPPGGDGHRPGR